MADSAIITAADYADALLTARRAKNWLFLFLLLMLLIQLGIFIAARRWPDTILSASATASASTTQPSVNARDWLRYLTGVSDFLGIALGVVLSIVVLLIIKIMLVGRLVGVARVTSAFIWSLVLIVLLFPWQAFLDPYVFKLPGVLYTWDELMKNARFDNADLATAILRWARFVGFPVVAIIMLLAVQVKSTRGVRQALGEGDRVVVENV